MRAWVLIGLVLSLAVPAQAAREALPRAAADRVDDSAAPQVHVVYALPSDGLDRGLDMNGTIEATVHSWNGWLATQTAGKGGLRLDTAGGALDVTFFRDPHTDAEIRAQGAFVRDLLQSDLHAAGLDAPNKLYAVYYDGTSSFACGGGAWPPDLPGDVAAMYLHGLDGTPAACDQNQFTPGGAPGYLEFAMVHEIMHTLGFVPTCAPHHTLRGHVSDAANDLMYAGDAPWQLPPTLDVGHDDYFETGRMDCLDLARSPFLESNVPVTPPASPTVKPKPKPKPPLCKKRQHSTKRKPCRRQ